MNIENAELVGNIVSDCLHIAGVIMHLQRYRGEEDNAGNASKPVT